ncbi:MAG: DedA family protein [Bacteroidaceae bacterium]|nr:DedA family protein [Bacteroidaceae bacterium]MBR5842159.1 DedA family protein [Bacteroidaceae bacterium]
MESVQFIQWCLDHLNYWTVTLLMTIESSFIPFPSEIVVPPAAYRAASTGELNIWLVIFFSTLGAVFGALINYYLALWLGKPIVYKFANSRFGHMCLINQEKVETAEKFFNKHGVIATFIGRLVTVVRQLISIPAGLAKMNIVKFIIYTALGAGIWNAVLAALGWYLESVVPEEELISTVTEYSDIIGYAIVALVVLGLGYIIYKGVKKK